MQLNSFLRIGTLVLCALMALLGIIIFGFYTSTLSCSISLSASGGRSPSSPIQEKALCKNRSRQIASPQGFSSKQPSIMGGRSDVVTVTPWLAPIVWEGTFDPLLIDAIYRPMNFSIAATVFAVGKYIRFLKDFLETAEEHFMVGFKVHYHIFTDQPDEVPQVSMGDGRNISVHHIAKLNRWQDISSSRMRIIQNLIEEQVHREADYIFCLDVDTKFHFRWGAEALDQLVAQIHPWFYDMSRNQFTYERRPISTAYIPQDKGDFYYIGAMFGGMVEDVHRLVQTCCRNLEADSANGIEAAWQEESHLNWYLLYNKPSKVLSPEYLWHDQRGRTEVMKVIRLSQIIKNNAEVRENV
ncbi:globoside alpha-1,3-N-acetylgalactosaminyltransferase 1-like [Scleropages formosus]|uniref:Globoside alpha-1,3-N-acetylgalactosaminyltransferase 1 (FORS blood group) n=1 Tax=Scleropages formosus TaxID=113540 RepID=A0A8C9WUT7_SCLFO|nr:globoside alpha-1,3-N-acetylgalactosaminyltransferase 1-like [Scleropages formosus]